MARTKDMGGYSREGLLCGSCQRQRIGTGRSISALAPPSPWPKGPPRKARTAAKEVLHARHAIRGCMTFTSWQFGVFVAVVFGAYYLSPFRHFQVQLLVLASIFFYGY